MWQNTGDVDHKTTKIDVSNSFIERCNLLTIAYYDIGQRYTNQILIWAIGVPINDHVFCLLSGTGCCFNKLYSSQIVVTIYNKIHNKNDLTKKR